MLYLPVGSVRCWMHNLLWMNPAAEQEILKVELELSIVSPFSVNPSPQSSAQSQQKVCNWHLFYLQLLNLEGRQPNIPEQPYQSELSTSQTSPLDTIWDYLLRYLTGYVSCFFGKICPSALFFVSPPYFGTLQNGPPGPSLRQRNAPKFQTLVLNKPATRETAGPLGGCQITPFFPR